MAKPRAKNSSHSGLPPIHKPGEFITITPEVVTVTPSDFTRGFMTTAGVITACCVFSAIVCAGIWLHGNLPW